MVNAASPYRDLKSFIDASRAQPDKLTMTSADPGTTSEVGVKLFVAQTGAAVRQILTRPRRRSCRTCRADTSIR